MSDDAVAKPAGPRRVVGVVLAGGRSRRMAGLDKALVPLAGQPLVERAILRLAPQVASIVLSANGARGRFEPFGRPIVSDPVPGFAGPLAGMLAGLAWAREYGRGATHIATVAVDSPFFPLDLVARLSAAAADGRIAVASSAGRPHPVFSLVPLQFHGDLTAFIAEGRSLRVADWLARQDVAVVDFDVATRDVDPFFNVNTPADLARAAALAARCTSH